MAHNITLKVLIPRRPRGSFFKSRSFVERDLKNKPRGRPITLIDNDELKVIAEADNAHPTAE